MPLEEDWSVIYPTWDQLIVSNDLKKIYVMWGAHFHVYEDISSKGGQASFEWWYDFLFPISSLIFFIFLRRQVQQGNSILSKAENLLVLFTQINNFWPLWLCW